MKLRPNMLPATTKASVIAAVLLVMVAGGAAAQVVVDRMTSLPAGTAFRIGENVVTVSQLDRRVDLLKSLYGVQPPKDPGKRDKFNRDTAKAIAVSEILDSAAKAEGIVIADKAANDQLAKLIKETYRGDRETFLRTLGSTGLSERNVLDEIKRQQTSAKLFERVTANVRKATDGDARTYYDSHKKEMVSPEQRQLSNIVVKTRQEADQVLLQAQSGTDFATLARQRSLDGQSKAKGGDLGMVSARELDAGYARAAFAAKPNTLFGPVQTGYGWNVGKVSKVQPAVPLSFDQLKQNIKVKLDNDATLKRWNAWLSERIRTADVEYAPQYRPADPDAPPQQVTGR